VTTDLARCHALQMIKMKQILFQKTLAIDFFILEQQKVVETIWFAH